MKKLYTTLVIALISMNAFGQAPGWQWAKSAGGSSSDYGQSVSTDASGNVFMTGYFSSPTITFGTTTLTNAGSWDIFIVKYDASGNVLWAKSAGGASDDEGRSVSTDASGNVFITGYFGSPTITFGTTTLTSAGAQDIFIVKYDSTGNVLWAKSEGGVSVDEGRSVSTDASGNVFITGEFYSPTITFGTTTLTPAGTYDMFLAKYDAAGNVLWAKSAGGNSADYVNSVSTDASGNVLITGASESATITFGTTTLTNVHPGYMDIFIVKYDAAGNVLWAKLEGGAYNNLGLSVSTDASGNVFVTGYFSSPTITFGTTTLTSAGTYDIFIVKYDASGNVLWAKSAGGASGDYVYSVSTDASGNVFITGFFASSTITFGTTTLTNTGADDIFIVKYNASGNVLWAKSAGGAFGDDVGYGVTTDVSGNAFITGYFGSPSITFGATTLTNSATTGTGSDIFIAKLVSTEGIPEIANQQSQITISPNPITSTTTITFSEEQKNTSLKITDVSGNVILQSTINNRQSTIDLSGYDEGIYFVRIESFDKLRMTPNVINRKIVKE